ncbi:hypothetical protein [Haloarcula sp. Atlit-120R]|uniref:hypothetical protein n=1 Tax=Haloarcula sp. Atlit-120R TaxID=2282135 RepID=UPI000EF207DC|nr:hypothetical protein [Haloarcula sp. Atlit-120R]RLM32648.1 hypothetical protein DVK01_20460 [Haloarcula sp. Atlit-120R]
MSEHDDLNSVNREDTKYGDRVGDALDRPAPEPETEPADHVNVGTHYLTVNDEREAIEQYNGLQWTFVIEAGTITAVDCSHYCPGPGHVDPMGFRAWDDVPELVRDEALSALNGHGREGDVVDIEAVDEAAERSL